MSLSKGVFFAPAAAAIHALCFNESWKREEFEKLLALPTSRLWIDEKALLLCSEVPDEMEILTLGVIPEKRRQHLAQKLLEDLFQYAKNQQVKRIFLEVAEDNKAAQKLYFKMGFIETGRRSDYYHHKNKTIDALCLTKEI